MLALSLTLAVAVVQSKPPPPAPSRADVLTFLRAHRAADDTLVAGRSADALREFERCLELQPEHGAAAYGAACALSRLGQLDEAIASFERAAANGWSDPDVARFCGART